MSLMTLPRRSIWPAHERWSIWPGRRGDPQEVLPGGATDSILTESGDYIITESGEYIILE